MRFTEKYAWALDMLKEEFGPENVHWQEFDRGRSFAVGVTNGKGRADQRRHAVMLERFYIVGWDLIHPVWVEPWGMNPVPVYRTFEASPELFSTIILEKLKKEVAP